MTRRLHILDHSLVGRIGHSLNYDLALMAAAEQRGLPARLYCCRDADPEVVDESGAVPLFTHSFMHSFEAAPNESEQRNFLLLNAAYFEDLRRISPDVDGDAVLFLPTVRHNRLFGLFQWLTTFPADAMPRAVVFLRWHEAGNPFLRLCVNLLHGLNGRVRFCTDTPGLSEEYASAGLPRPDVVPIPHVHAEAKGTRLRLSAADRAAVTRLRQSGDMLVAGYFGAARYDKGFHRLPDMIEGTRAIGLPVRFLVQTSSSEGGNGVQAASIAEAFRRLRAMAGDDLILIDQAVDAATYQQLLALADIVLLPYVASFYRSNSSGIFSEALANGQVVLVPAGTWLAEEASRIGGGAATFAEDVPGDIVTAVMKAVLGHHLLAASARAAAERWRAEHDPGRLLDYLMAETS